MQDGSAEGVEDWRVIGDGACAYFRTASFAASAQLVRAISELPGVEEHEPDVDLRHDGVTVRLITITDDYYGMSQRDIELARQISAAARKLGLSADPSAVQSLLVIPGATVTAEVMPFWRAVLGYEPRPDSPAEDLVDPRSRGPSFWFEQMKKPRADGGAIHVAIWVPYEQAEARIAAALAAAGWCATRSRPHGGRWPTRRATRPTSPPRWAATSAQAARRAITSSLPGSRSSRLRLTST